MTTTKADDTASGEGTAEVAAVPSHSASATAARTPAPTGPALLEPLPGDLYGYEQMLPEDDQRVLLRLREWLQREVAPVANARWSASEFPHELVPKLGELGVIGLGYDRPGRPAASRLLTSFVTLEISRVDTSFATFFGVHSGLAMGSIVLLGSDEQRERWLPDMFALKKVGAFALTEPLGGSDVAGGLRTTARREGDEWVLDGEKRWIGNATFADLVVVWARDVADGSVKGFVVQKGTPGFTATKMEGKLALRSVQNADIVLDGCRVPETDRLQGANSFKDTGKVLQLTRGGVAWNSVGCQMGAYEAALRYSVEREQFGRPIAGFQLVQDLLVKMLGNITASLGLTVRVAELQEAGQCTDAQAALAKAYCTSRMRETVAYAREVLGGNGILLDHDVARFFNDAEALYSYEGTREINTLIVGRAITGIGAFV
jgi:glutaryl-CoA dehydrogenase